MQPLSRDTRLHFPIANGWYGIVGLRHSYYGSSIGKRQGRVPVGGIGAERPVGGDPYLAVELVLANMLTYR